MAALGRLNSGVMLLKARQAKQADLPRDDDRAMQQFWADYRERLSRVRQDVASINSPATASAKIGLSVVRPRRQPVWGSIAMTIALAVKRIWNGDGHVRAERREEAWYHF